MGWADRYVDKLKSGFSVTFRPRGHSMTGKVMDGEQVTVFPLNDSTELSTGDVVLCEVGRSQYLHLIKDIRDGKYLIGNNRGGTNGWIARSSIFGKMALRRF